MEVILYPRAAPCNELKIWIGVFGVTTTPTLEWFFGDSWIADASKLPTALRPIKSVRPNSLFINPARAPEVPRAFSGVYQFTELDPDRNYVIKARADGKESKPLTVRTLPRHLPKGPEGRFNILLVSCFFQPGDGGALESTLARLQPALRPDLTLMAGDQVYLDMPALKDFPIESPELAEIFENNYSRNWLQTPGYARLLSMAPTLSMADDHEYWNNYPNICPWNLNTLSQENRDKWEAAAKSMWEGFQMSYPSKNEPPSQNEWPPTAGDPVVLDIDPISIFMADTRTTKEYKGKYTLDPKHLKKLNDWVDRLLREKKTGIFVSGQSLLQAKVDGSVKALAAGYSLSNYEDYADILKALRRLADGGRPVLFLTGDVHWSRITTIRDVGNGRMGFCEVISSPTSLVDTPGWDQLWTAKNAVAKLINKGEYWPRHSRPQPPPENLAPEVFRSAFKCDPGPDYQGNCACLLSFNQGAAGVDLNVRFIPITSDAEHGRIGDKYPIPLAAK